MHDERQKFYGEWQALSGVLAGAAMAEEIVSATKLTLMENAYAVNLAGAIDCGLCEIHPQETPVQMKVVGQHGPNVGKTFFAIVEFLEADQIRIAYDLSGTEYPGSFEPSSAPTSYVATFRRA
ncbi:MAG: hypothetical protein AAF725_15775 [Acidobacteriota bacterium]